MSTSEKTFGPAIVATANAARAFDAPVRYPLLFAFPTTDEYGMAKNAAFISVIEHFLGVLILLPILVYKRGIAHFLNALKQFDRREWISVIFISAGGSALGLFFFLISLGLGNPTVAILIQKTQPLITLIFAAIILKERPSRNFWIALIIAIIGIAMLVYPDIIESSQTADTKALVAILCSLAAAVFWGGSTVFGRILTDKNDYWDITLYRYIGGFFFLLVFNVLLLNYTQGNFDLLNNNIGVFGNPDTTINFNWKFIGFVCILYSAIITGGILPLALYYYGLKMSKAAIAGLAELTFPVLAIFVNEIFLGFGLEPIQIIGAIILLVDVSTLSYINMKEAERQKS
ncbi:MAG: DMT family transporter [Candidatus Hodarchaeales archaeon]|jgi:drug/metabolite transporter (DMT)-like permease